MSSCRQRLDLVPPLFFFFFYLSLDFPLEPPVMGESGGGARPECKSHLHSTLPWDLKQVVFFDTQFFLLENEADVNPCLLVLWGLQQGKSL